MNNKTSNLIITFLIYIIFYMCTPLDANTGEKVRISADTANIRSSAGLDGEIIGKAYRGDIFEILGVEGSWYKILFVNNQGESLEGFVYSSIVEIISPDTKKKQQSQPPLSEKKVELNRKVNNYSSVKFDQEKLFSGFYLKGGVMTSPKVDSLGEKWIISLGFDSPIGSYLTWGLEFQPYYRSFSEDVIDLTIHSLASNIFLNVKGGINLGKFVHSLKFLILYGGVGIGSELSFFYVDIDGVTGSEFNVRFAWHYMIGGEISLGKMNVIMELQGVKVIDPDIDPSTQSMAYFMVGLRF